jgi:hypothetical protein
MRRFYQWGRLPRLLWFDGMTGCNKAILLKKRKASSPAPDSAVSDALLLSIF